MNVFFLEAPHQLVNALEAKHDLGLEDNEVVVVTSRSHPADAFQAITQNGHWDRVRYLDERPPVHLGLRRHLWDHPSPRIKNYSRTLWSRTFRRKLDRIAASLGKVDTLVAGCYFNERVRHFANTLPHDRLVLLDDGTTTLQIAEARRRYATGEVVQPSDHWTQPLMNRLLGWHPEQEKRATFFTVYDLDLPSTDTLIHHSYEYLRQCSAEVGQSNEVLFLGMSLYWEGVDEDEYIRQLRRVERHYAGSEIVYVPHKGEKPNRVERIRRELGWTVRSYGVPIEYQLAMRGPLPRVLASFFSSALENCRIIFDSQFTIEALYFEPDLLPLQPVFVQTVYDYFESHRSGNFRVVRL